MSHILVYVLTVDIFDASVNGTLVGTVSKYIKGPLFPTVAVHSQNEEYALISLIDY